VHRADDVSLEFLLLARRAPALPILLLLTYRSDEAHPGLRCVLAELDRARLAAEWALEPLDKASVKAMLRAIFGLERPVRRDVLDALYAQTEAIRSSSRSL
jgi:hypothetical protein